MGIYLRYDQLGSTATQFPQLAADLEGQASIPSCVTGIVDISAALTDLGARTADLARATTTIGAIAAEVRDDVTTIDENQAMHYRLTNQYLQTTVTPTFVGVEPGPTPIRPEGMFGYVSGPMGAEVLTLPPELQQQGPVAPEADQ